jgi:hypothetical protein
MDSNKIMVSAFPDSDEDTPRKMQLIFAFLAGEAEIILGEPDEDISGIDSANIKLSGYPGCTPVLGEAVSGGVKVTLYKEFITALPNGNYTLTTTFNDGTIQSAAAVPFTVSGNAPAQPSGDTSGGSGSDYTAPAANTGRW